MARRDPEDDAVAFVAVVVRFLTREDVDTVTHMTPFWARCLDGSAEVNDLRAAVEAAVAERWMSVSDWPREGEECSLTIKLTERGKTIGRS